jgi:hypothetical protein
VFYETRTVEYKNGAERPNSTYPDVIANGSQQMENKNYFYLNRIYPLATYSRGQKKVAPVLLRNLAKIELSKPGLL